MQADLTAPGALQRALDGVETVFHLAAAHLGVSVPDREYNRVNVEAIEHLVAAAREAKVRRFVHCSSVGVFGPIRHPPADENTPCRPEIVYEKTKLAGEEMVRKASLSTGPPAVILRPVWVYGPGCPRTERLFSAIASGRFVLAGRGDGLRHCVYVRDMVQAFLLAAEADCAPGQVFIIGDLAAVKVRRLVQTICDLTLARPPRSVPSSFLYLVGLIAELLYRPLLKEPPLSRRTLRFFTSNTSFDISRARKTLGYEPRYEMASGLAETHRLMSERQPWRVLASDYEAA